MRRQTLRSAYVGLRRYHAANLATAIVQCLVLMTFVLGTDAFAQGYDHSGPWWSKVQRPLLGVAYTAEPSDYSPGQTVCSNPSQCKYFDSDFTNDDFKLLWGPQGRNDLAAMAKQKMNFIALYDWSGGGCRDHKSFLDWANSNRLQVAVPFSRDYNVAGVFDPAVAHNIRTIVYEVYGLDTNGNGTPNLNPAVNMWRIGNENGLHGLPAANTAQVAKIVLEVETEKAIPDSQKLLFTSDVDFGVYNNLPPGISPIIDLKNAFIAAGLSDVWYTRFIASINTTNPGSDIDNYVKNVFSQQSDFGQGDRLSLLLTEYGRDSKSACEYERDAKHKNLDCSKLSDMNQGQLLFDAEAFYIGRTLAQSPKESSTGYFYGHAVFQWQDAFWKTGTESLFGIQSVGNKTMDGSISGGKCGLQPASYPVNNFVRKPAFAVVPDGRPDPDVKANGSDGPITLASNERLSVTAQLADIGQEKADWWVLAKTPLGEWYYYVYPNQWVLANPDPFSIEDVSVAHEGPLFELMPFELLRVQNLQPGAYRFYFGVDLHMNGKLDLDQTDYDQVDVVIK